MGQLSPGPAHQGLGRSSGVGSGAFCLLSFPVTREDIDTVSVRFQPMEGISVLVRSDAPSLLRLRLDTGMDSGGSLTITLRVNKVLS